MVTNHYLGIIIHGNGCTCTVHIGLGGVEEQAFLAA